jgi:hypothetical protein
MTMDKDKHGGIRVTKVTGASKDLGVAIGDSIVEVADVAVTVGGDVKSVASMIREASRPVAIKLERPKTAVVVMVGGSGSGSDSDSDSEADSDSDEESDED